MANTTQTKIHTSITLSRALYLGALAEKRRRKLAGERGADVSTIIGEALELYLPTLRGRNDDE